MAVAAAPAAAAASGRAAAAAARAGASGGGRGRTRRAAARAVLEFGGADIAAGVSLATGVREGVQTYYGETLRSSDDLKTSACCTNVAPPAEIVRLLQNVPEEIRMRYYGCGSPTPLGIEGLRVLDLGCGTGRDCYVASALVGEHGSVTGVDMTPQQLECARKYAAEYTQQLGYAESNMRFAEGQIEDLKSAGIEDESVDLVISNCVINLSDDKEATLREVWRVLAQGGEFYFSDVYADRRLPAELRSHDVLVGECLGGALYEEDFRRLVQRIGFMDPRTIVREPIIIEDPELAALLGEAKFCSVTYRLFKLPEGALEDKCEDYGQFARYKGTIKGHEAAYSLDDHHRLERNKPFLVCGNTAAMLEEPSWLAKHFEVVGDRSTHYGLFPCDPPGAPMGDGVVAGACC
eukprot:PRCOL_00001560-RA